MAKYTWPVPGHSRISSKWGNRIHPISGRKQFHDGIDIPASKGTKIVAAAAGTVEKSGDYGNGYGKYIAIQHANGVLTFYGHCSKIVVSRGAKVTAGQKIGEVGSTGYSTGNHVHFGLHKNGVTDNPSAYVKYGDVTSASSSGSAGSSSGASSGGSTAVTVKAKFTAYYPANNSMEGGFYDAQGNKLDPSKHTCAAPKSVSFGTSIKIQGTGTAKDGLVYTVTDRGGAINIEDGVYHFDLLMSSKAECNAWGVVYGEAVIGGEGDSTETSQEITSVVVKSITGTSAVQKEKLTGLEPYLQNGAEIIIQNGEKGYLPCVSGDITLERARKDGPSKLSFTVVKDSVLNFQEGNPVSFRYNGTKMFFGYVFSKSRKELSTIDVVCYDQIRYLKNKDTFSYDNKTYTDLLKMIAADYGLKCGTLVDTSYVIAHRIEEGTLLDMLQNASDLTVLNTGKLFVLYDDFGKLQLKNIQDMKLPILIDRDTAQSFGYTSTIDKDTYTRIKLAVDNGDTGEREVHILNDTTNQAQWGILQYYNKEDSGSTETEIMAKAQVLMNYYSKKHRTLQITGAFGDTRVFGGSSLIVNLEIGDIVLKNYMCVEKVKHTFAHGLHTMDLNLSGIRGEFVV